MTTPTLAADEFERHRPHLRGVAYRMLGSLADAEDAVQETWLRWQRTERATVDDPRAWLTTVTSRISLDQLRSARVRREAYVGPWLPEPIVQRLPDTAPDPADRVALDGDVEFALLAVLEKLTPEQRVAFVLHDVFDLPFTEIAEVVGSTPESARQLASRARRAVRDGRARHTASAAEQREVLDAFQAACERGDLDALLTVLAPEITATGDGGGVAPAGARPIAGHLQVARFLLGLYRRSLRDDTFTVEPVLINGDLGLLSHTESFNGQPVTAVMSFAIADGKITAVFNQLNPAKHTHVPAPDPTHNTWTRDR